MIPPPTTPVDVGQPNRPSARTHNAFVSAARAVAGMQTAIGARNAPPRPDAPVLVRVFNDTGDTLEQFAPAAIDEPLVTPTMVSGTVTNADEMTSTLVLKLKVPDAVYDAGNFVVMAETLADQQIGLAYADGIFLARVDIDSVDDFFADVQSSADELLTGSSGSATILWKQSGTGTGKLAVIRMGSPAGAGGGGTFPLFRIDSNRSTYEAYKGYILNITATTFNSSGGTSPTAASIGTDGTEVTLINFQQGSGKSTHALTAGTPELELCFASPLGFNDDGGKPCYAIIAKRFKSCP